MPSPEETLAELVGLARWLGAPERDLVVVSEGNVSARLDADRLLVKASGSRLGDVGPDDFVEVRCEAVVALLDRSIGGEPEVRAGLAGARTDATATGRPSIETPLHALCLGLPRVRFVGHTHPTPIVTLVCSAGCERALATRLYPDQVVACGPRSLLVPPCQPGVELGRALRSGLQRYLDRWGEAPKTVYLRNHGFAALGQSAQEVRDLTRMAVKAARVLAGVAAFGGPHTVDQADDDSIHAG